jgi:hypothetical protein
MTDTVTTYLNGREIDVTELETLEVTKVSAVDAPASGLPFLVMKSAAKAWGSYTDADVAALVADPNVSKEIKAEIADKIEAANGADNVNTTKSDNRGGPGIAGLPGSAGLNADDVSAEADAICELITGTSSHQGQAAKEIFKNPKSSPAAKRIALTLMKGEVQDSLKGEDLDPLPPAHDANDLSAVAKAEADFNAATDPVEKENAGTKLTLERLKALHARTLARREPASKAIDTSTDPAPIARLRELVKSADLDPSVKMQAAETLTKFDLAKSAYSDQLTATADLVRATQAQIQADPQSATGASSLAQTGTIGSGRGTPQQLAAAGRREPEPAAVLGAKEDELAKATDSIKRERLGEEVTRLRLAMTH